MRMTKADLRVRGTMVLLALSLSSCATLSEVTKRNIDWYKQNTSELKEPDVKGFFDNEDKIVNDIAQSEHFALPLPNGDWKPFVVAGMSYSRDRCTKYLEAVFYFNRVRAIGSRELTSTHVLAAALLQAAKAANALAAITAAGFNFGNETLDNFGSGMLYGVEPGTLRKLVAQEQDSFETTAQSRDGMLPQWGIDATAYDALRAPPTDIDGYDWIGPDDYPRDAMAQGMEGDVVARVGVDGTGKVTNCAVVASSGSESLDQLTCRAALAKGRFNPAIGADGQATAAVRTVHLIFELQP